MARPVTYCTTKGHENVPAIGRGKCRNCYHAIRRGLVSSGLTWADAEAAGVVPSTERRPKPVEAVSGIDAAKAALKKIKRHKATAISNRMAHK